ncbi:MAG: PDDEXK nuclease domain-containing protein [Desulfobacterales bacterium]|nr:PDDEXK nuclease domain-containing protein [Desulfobacterales bacterium]
MKLTPANPEYAEFLADLKNRIAGARVSAARTVNREMILLYWDIGRGIVEKQKALGWGKSVVDRLAVDLNKEFPALEGFSASNLWRMRQLYAAFIAPKFLAQAVRELAAMVPWGQHVVMLPKMKDPAEYLYYLHATARFGWTRKVLLNQIKAGAYERSLAEGKTHNFPAALPEHLAEQAEETLKSSYNLEFLGIRREVTERELEDRLIERLKGFILELSYGFCFIGRQYRLVLGKKEYFNWGECRRSRWRPIRKGFYLKDEHRLQRSA